MKTVSVNDFFCGAGGMGLGFKNAGFRLGGAWDFDKYAVESYGHNVSPKVKQMDITQMTATDVPNSDVWTFGAPCQAFSIAGKQLGMTFKCPSCNHEETFEGELIIDRITFCSECGTLSKAKDIRGILFFEVMRLLKETEDKPPMIMLENVKGVSKFLDVIAYEYEKRGYRLVQTLYNSKYWGLAQSRERYFVAGVRIDIEKEFEFPIQQDKYIPRLSTILEPVVDEKYYISPDKTKSILEQVENKIRIKEATKKGYAEATIGDSINLSHPNSKTRRGRVGKQVAQTLLTGQEQVVVEAAHDLHGVIADPSQAKREGEHRIYTETSPTLNARDYKEPRLTVVGTLDIKGMDVIKRVYDQEGLSPTLTTSEGGNRQPKILEVGNTNPSGRGMNGKVIHEEGISSTLTTNKGEGIKVLKNDYRVRKLTPREYARLQGFPESFELVVSNSQAYKQFGNAVSVPVAQAIAERIRMFLLSL